MFGTKSDENKGVARMIHAEWQWVNPEYNLSTTRAIKDLKSIEIDPSQRMADVNKSNNKLVIPD
jgi:hypothetical protein